MPSRPPGNPNARGSAHLSVVEHDLQLTENHVPILAPSVPVLDDPLGCQVQHLPQGIVFGEGGLVLCNLPELPVQTLNNVRRVYDFPNLRWIFKEGVQNLPVILPASDAGRILLPPSVSKDTQILLRFVQRDGSVDLLQVGNYFLDILVADIFGRTADLVDDAPLQTALWIHRLDGFHHAAQAVGAEQINISIYLCRISLVWLIHVWLIHIGIFHMWTARIW